MESNRDPRVLFPSGWAGGEVKPDVKVRIPGNEDGYLSRDNTTEASKRNLKRFFQVSLS